MKSIFINQYFFLRIKPYALELCLAILVCKKPVPLFLLPCEKPQKPDPHQ